MKAVTNIKTQREFPSIDANFTLPISFAFIYCRHKDNQTPSLTPSAITLPRDSLYRRENTANVDATMELRT